MNEQNLPLKRLKARNLAVLLALLGVVALFYTITIVKMSPPDKKTNVETVKPRP